MNSNLSYNTNVAYSHPPPQMGQCLWDMLINWTLSQSEAGPNLSDVAMAVSLHEVLVQSGNSRHTVIGQHLNTLLQNQSMLCILHD